MKTNITGHLCVLFTAIITVAVCIAIQSCEVEPQENNTITFREEAPDGLEDTSVYWQGEYMYWTYVLIRGHRYVAVKYGTGSRLCFDMDHDVDCPKCNGKSPTESEGVTDTSPTSDYQILFGKN